MSPMSVFSTISDCTWCFSGDALSPPRAPSRVFCLSPIPNHNACDEAFPCPRLLSINTTSFTTAKPLQKPRAGMEWSGTSVGLKACCRTLCPQTFVQPFLVTYMDFDLFVKLWTQGDPSPFLVPLLLTIPM